MALMFDSGVVISGEIRHFSHLRVNRFIHGDVMWPYNYRISNFLDIKSITDCTLTKTKNVLPTKFSAKVANFLPVLSALEVNCCIFTVFSTTLN